VCVEKFAVYLRKCYVRAAGYFGGKYCYVSKCLWEISAEEWMLSTANL
jgi:hypothetical protein